MAYRDRFYGQRPIPGRNEVRVNDRIRISPVRLIGADGEQVGIVPVKEALERARAANLDLVEVAPNVRPPVCRIMDYGRFKYETSKKQKVARKKQHTVQIKEMRFRPRVDTHDYEFKLKHVRDFLTEGNKVKVFVMFRGREMAHMEFGSELLQKVAKDLEDIAAPEGATHQEGRNMIMVISPKPQVVKQAAAIRAAKAKAEKPGEEERHASDGEAPKTLLDLAGGIELTDLDKQP